jgi:hypothetical protein
MLNNVKAQRACDGPQLGYLLSLVGLSFKLADVADTILLTLFVLHLVLPNFANVTLSQLYFDITKDCLYAYDLQSVREKSDCHYPCQSEQSSENIRCVHGWLILLPGPRFYDCSSGPSAPLSDRGNPQNSS